MKALGKNILAILGILFVAQTTQAQNVMSYATCDYDEETNVIYGYAWTEADYASRMYYGNSYVGAKLRDVNDTELAAATRTVYGRAEVSLQAPGNGNPPYKIQSGHVIMQSYFVYNYYDPYTHSYRNGYYDYYYMNYYGFAPPSGGGPIFNWPLFFDFLGRNPSTVTPSPNITLGTLLNAIFPFNDEVTFKTANVHDKTANFTKVVSYSATISMENSSHAQEVCVDSQWFTLRVDFLLSPDSTLAANRCTARPLDIPDQDYQWMEDSVNCSMDTELSGHLNVTLRRRCCPSANQHPKISVGVGCNRNGPGICDTKAVVKILC
jgi:hypothetical protein